MGAVSEGGSTVPVVVVEFASINCEVFSSGTNDSVRTGCIKESNTFRVGRFTNRDGVFNLSSVVRGLISFFEFNTSEDIISGLEVFESDISDLAGNSRISGMLKACELSEFCSED